MNDFLAVFAPHLLEDEVRHSHGAGTVALPGGRTSMAYTHVLNRGGTGVQIPANALVQWLSRSQLQQYYAGRYVQ